MAEIQVAVQCAPQGSWALSHSGLPLVRHCVLTNVGDKALQNVLLTFSAEPALFAPRQCRIAHMDEASTLRLAPLPLVYDADVLSGITAPTSAQIRVDVTVGDSPVTSCVATLPLLPRSMWGGAGVCPESLAAFVCPYDVALEPFLAASPPDIAGGTAAGNASAGRRVATDTAVGNAAAGDSEVLLQGSSVADAAGTGAAGAAAAAGQAANIALLKDAATALLTQITAAVLAQGVRLSALPQDVAAQGVQVCVPTALVRAQAGTVLDMALLLAAALERRGFSPLLVLGSASCLVGVWLDASAGTIITDAATFATSVAQGHAALWEVDTDGVRPVHSDAAWQKDFLFALDINRARAQNIAPLPCVDGGSEAAAPSTPPLSKMERWQRNLLDMSLRNALLNFRQGKRFVECVIPAPTAGAGGSGGAGVFAASGSGKASAGIGDSSGGGDASASSGTSSNISAGNSPAGATSCDTPDAVAALHALTQGASAVENMLAEGVTFTFMAGLQGVAASDALSSTASFGSSGSSGLFSGSGQSAGSPLSSACAADEIGAASSRLRVLAAESLPKKRFVVPLSEKELNSRLLTLFRAARLALEEGGANTLYLAVGFLSWREKGRPTPCLAPLLLLPLRLDRRTVQSGFSVSLYDEEARFNLTLLELLRREHNITALDDLADALPTDERGVDVAALWRRVGEAVAALDGWEIVPRMGLGLFSFSKYLMWKDLCQQPQLEQTHAVIRQLIHPETLGSGIMPFLAAQDLDDKLPPDKTFCPMLADSSQLAAIATAAQGQSFVLSGPPGTGKSQTITNMIAHCLGTGKSVLFVAEKAAALNVVHRRLQKCGLDPYCLQLHSSKMKKLEVLSQLHDAVRVESEFSQGRWGQETARLQELRVRLNGYVRALHKVYPNGLTVYAALGTVQEKSDVPRVDLRWPTPGYHTEQAYADLLEAARTLELYATEAIALAQTPVGSVAQEDFSPLWSQELLAAASRTCAAAAEMKALPPRLAEVLPAVSALRDNKALAALTNLLTLLPTAYGRDWSFIARAEGWGVQQQLTAGMEKLRELRQGLAGLSAPADAAAVMTQLEGFDLAAVQKLWDEAQSAWWPKNSMLKSQVAKALHPLYAAQAKFDAGADLPRWARLRETVTALGKAAPLTAATGGLWQGVDTDADAVAAALAFGDSLRQCLAALGTNLQAIQSVTDDIARLLGVGSALLAPGGAFASLGEAWHKGYTDYASALAALRVLLGNEQACADMDLTQTEAFCISLPVQEQHLSTWCAWLRARRAAEAQGLAPLVQAVVEGRIAPAGIATALTVNYARWWLVQVVETMPHLKAFAAREQDQAVLDFCALDESVRLLTSQCVRAHMPERSSLITDAPAEWAVLKKQMTLKRRHMPLRQLLSSLPTLLRRLTPCFLMSPLSVAQYLEPGKHQFDVVIFDEASQIPVWDALGAMAHGRNVIVVGDQKQLPPTNFFAKGEDSDEASTDVDMESILDQCVTSNLPLMHLRWHYRSRNESLITFSNQQYYDGALVTFPAPQTQDKGVQWHFVGGQYERGSTRTNPQEAQAVTEHIVQQLRAMRGDKKSLTIGVVTFNMQQQTLIEDLLEAERRKDPSLEVFFNSDTEEPVIVKNLENIQGDERDIMYFSIGFGRDAEGQMTMNFGALNKDGGERRLNVAVTRARRELHVFASIHADQISLAKTQARGVSDLRLFLDYAERGIAALSGITRYEDGEFASSFERIVATRLQERGWQVRAQVGVSVFRIDLGVADPDAPDEFLAGIACDGVNYARSAAARDRERLRDSVLEGLGWKMLRVWSMEWWLQPDRALARLDAALHAILEERRTARAAATKVAEAKAAETKTAGQPSTSGDAAASATHTATEPAVQNGGQGGDASVPPAAGQNGAQRGNAADDSIQAVVVGQAGAVGQAGDSSQANQACGSHQSGKDGKPTLDDLLPDMQQACAKVEQEHHARMLDALILAEFPVHESRLCRLFAAKRGLARVSSKLRAEVTALASEYPRTKEDVGLFYWPKGTEPRAVTAFPLRHVDDRSVDEIAMLELRALARTIYDDGMEDPAVKLGHMLGLERVRGAARDRLEDAWRTRNR